MSVFIRDDESGIGAALREAAASAAVDEVPVGCVIVHDGMIIGRGHNQVETLQDATAHAEIIAIGAASTALESWRLSECTMYVTLEPCAMCAGAIILSRVGRLVYGARDPKAGGCGSVLDVIHERRLNHRVDITPDVRAEECGAILKQFFARKRRKEAAPEGRDPRLGSSPAPAHAGPGNEEATMLATMTIQNALDEAIAHLKADSGTIHVKDPARMVLLLAASRNIPQAVLDIVKEVPWGKGMAGAAVEKMQPVSVCNIQTTKSPDVRPGARGAGMQGAIVVPMMKAGRPVGAFGVGCLGDREFTADETAWLLGFAGRLAEQVEA